MPSPEPRIYPPLFRCLTTGCGLTVRACGLRQDEARVRQDRRFKADTAPDFSMCLDCEQGRAVAGQGGRP